ncbi:MAG: TVP38/TMEM64 family protein [Chloroflexota bacterium]|nr:TVP38/TMEM64 family protein [Chloroflexota bacterium]
MRDTVILAVALAAGAAVAFGLREAFDTTGVALAAGIVVAWIVWGELSERLGGEGEEEAGDRPILFDPARRRRIIGAAALVLAVVFIIGDFAVGDLETDDIREWGEGLGPWGPVILIAILATAMVFAPIPNPPFMIAAGLIWGMVLGVVYAVIGQLIGAAIIFWISRRFGRKFIPRLVGERGAERIDLLAREIGPQLVFWWRMMPISFDFAAYAAGLTPMSFRFFMALVLFGSIVPTAVVVGFGDSLNHSWTARFVFGGLIVVAIAVPATVLYLRNRHRLPPPREVLRWLVDLES